MKARWTGYVQTEWHQSQWGDELETVFESLAGGKSILVPLGDGTVGYTRCAAA